MSFTFSHPRRTALAVAASVAATTSLAASAPANAAPNAAARLASTARSAPERDVVAIVQFDRSVSERQAKALARRHGARVAGRLPLIHGLTLRLAAGQAR